jgi:hypothetical protein
VVLYIEGGTEAPGVRKWLLGKIYAPKRDEITGSRGVEKTMSRKYYLGNQIKKAAMGGECSMYWGE